MKTDHIFKAAVLAMCVAAWGCIKIPENKASLDSSAKNQPLPSLQLPAKPEMTKYIYEGARLVDPFIQKDQGQTVFVSREVTSGSIDPASLFFKGFITDKSQQMALLNDTAGNTYIVKNGKLVDMKGRVIPGVSAKIKDESIFIETDDKITREIKLFEQ